MGNFIVKVVPWPSTVSTSTEPRSRETSVAHHIQANAAPALLGDLSAVE